MSFFWNNNNFDYETQKYLPGDIILPDKNNNLYTVSREEPTTALEFLGLEMDLANTSPDALEDITRISQEYSAQMNRAKCNKTSCLNAFNTSFMPTLSYRMIATQFAGKMEQSDTSSYLCYVYCCQNVQEYCPCRLLQTLQYQGIGVKILTSHKESFTSSPS